MRQIFTLLSIMCFFGVSSVHAQSGVFKNVTLTPSLGIMNYFGDIKNYDTFTTESGGNESSLGYGLGLSKGFSRVFALRLQGIGGKLKGTKDSFGPNGVYFTTDIFEVGLNLDINLTNIFLKQSKFGVIASGGYSYSFFDASTFDKASDASFVGPRTENDVKMAGAISTGLAAYYQISPRFDIIGRGSYKMLMSDKLDSWRGLHPSEGRTNIDPDDPSTYTESGDDSYSYISLGLVYHFSKSEKSPGSKGDKGKSVEDLAEEARVIEEQRIAEEQRKAEEERRAKELAETEAQKKIEDAETARAKSEEDAALFGSFTYNGLAAANKKLNLVDENDNVIATTTTDANGNFTFSPLKPGENYLIKVDGTDGDMKNGEMFITNKNGERVLQANKKGEGTYTFTSLPEDELAKLGLLDGSDGKLKGEAPNKTEPVKDKPKADPVKDKPVADNSKSGTTKPVVEDAKKTSPKKVTSGGFENETIYFRHNSFWVTQDQNNTKGSIIAKKLKADPSMRIVIHGYASRVGDTEYNLLLSQRRADKLKSILVEKYGIDADRIETEGKGEVEDRKMSDEKARKAEIYRIN